jgi:hypothetical protein
MSLTARKNPILSDTTQNMERIEQMYPGRRALLELPGVHRYARVIDVLKAPVPGYYNKKKDLVVIEHMERVFPDKEDGSWNLVPTERIERTRADFMKVIGAV